MKNALRGAAALALVTATLAAPATMPTAEAVTTTAVCGSGNWRLLAQNKGVKNGLSVTVAAWRSGNVICAAAINNTGVRRPTFVRLDMNHRTRGFDWGNYSSYAGGKKAYLTPHTRTLVYVIGATYKDNTQTSCAASDIEFWVSA